MGKYSSEMKRKSHEGSEKIEQSKRLGENVVSEVGKKTSLLDSLPKDVDEEIQNLRLMVRESVKEEGRKVMETDVKTQLEAGQGLLKESSQIAQDQIIKNTAIVDALHRIESSGDLGTGAAREGIKVAETSKHSYEQGKELNERAGTEASNDFHRRLSVLMNM